MKLVYLDQANKQQALDLQAVFDGARDYLERLSGKDQENSDAFVTMHTLPDAKKYSDKFVFGCYDGYGMVGCIDLIRGYPAANVAFLGLLLIAERHQGRGLGRQFYDDAERVVRRWAEIDTIRLAVAEKNASVLPFWQRMGFSETGERSISLNKGPSVDCIMMQKSIKSDKTRYSMRCELHHREVVSVGRMMTKNDVSGLARLAERAYANSIDDEGHNLSQYEEEIRECLDGTWGEFVPDASCCITDRDEIVGATLVSIWKGSPLLTQCLVAPEHRGKGYGSKLIEWSRQRLLSIGWTTLTLGVSAGNTAAESLYVKLGFRKI